MVKKGVRTRVVMVKERSQVDGKKQFTNSKM